MGSSSTRSVVDVLRLPSVMLAHALQWWGSVVIRRPLHISGAAILVALVCSAGLATLKVETRSDKLWVPQDTQIMRNRQTVWGVYGQERFPAIIYLTSASGDEDQAPGMMTAESVKYAFELDVKIRASGLLDKACKRDGNGQCVVVSVLNAWCGYAAFEAEVLHAPEPNAALAEVISTRKTTCAGVPTTPDDLVFSARKDEDGQVVSADILPLVFMLGKEEGSLAFQKEFLAIALEEERLLAESKRGIRIAFETAAAVDEELVRSVTSDIPLMVAAFVLVGIIVPSIQYDKTNKRDSTPLLALLGLISVFLAVGMSYGIMCVAGVPFTSLCQVGPFIFFGVGVDDVVIILDALRAARRELGPGSTAEQRVQAAINTAGIAVTITSLTNCMAFALGSATAIPGVAWFCTYASLAILCDYLLQMSIFLGVVVWREQRLDEEDKRKNVTIQLDKVEHTAEPVKTTMAERAVMVYADVLLQYPVRMMVVLVFIGYAVVCIVFAPDIKTGLPMAHLVPDDSFLMPWFDVEEVLKRERGENFRLYFNAFDHSKPEAQARILAAWGEFLDESKYISPLDTAPGGQSSSENWLTTLYKMSASKTEPCRDLGVSAGLCVAASRPFGGVEPRLLAADDFASGVETLLAAVPAYKSVLILDPVSGNVMTSWFTVTTVVVGEDYGLKLSIFREAMSLDRTVNDKYFDEGAMFTFSNLLVFWQQEDTLWDEVILNLGLAATGVFIICTLTLVHVGAVFATAAVILVDLYLFGTMFIGNIRFNTISVVGLVVAIGLAVDYTLHFLHAFLSAPGNDRSERVRNAFGEIGAPILKGGLTTMAGTILLGFSKSVIFRTFFAMVFSTVVYGLSIGVMLLPVVCATIPLPSADHLVVGATKAKQIKAGSGD